MANAEVFIYNSPTKGSSLPAATHQRALQVWHHTNFKPVHNSSGEAHGHRAQKQNQLRVLAHVDLPYNSLQNAASVTNSRLGNH